MLVFLRPFEVPTLIKRTAAALKKIKLENHQHSVLMANSDITEEVSRDVIWCPHVVGLHMRKRGADLGRESAHASVSETSLAFVPLQCAV